jgi:dTMP kinase
MQGLFITFEGVEGAGKSTQIKLLADYLKTEDREVICTREPGGTESAERIRDLLVNGAPEDWSDMTECLLMNASRAQHLDELIRPALAEGKVVLCDRFMDSTRAYQGGAGGIDMVRLMQIEHAVVGNTVPDITFIFDLSADVGLERARARGGDDRFERKGIAYHERVRAAFLDIARGEPKRCVVLDAGASVENVTAQIHEALENRLKTL